MSLTTIKSRYLSQQSHSILASSQGLLDVVNDSVSLDNRLENTFQNLLEITAALDTVDDTNKAACALRYQVRIVTLDGTETHSGGSFSGGADCQNSTTSIKPELDNLVTKLQDLQTQQIKQEKCVQELRDALRVNKETLVSLKA